jgi:MoaA/NifB/PqqE/SkfB family radical SAM enzyme
MSLINALKIGRAIFTAKFFGARVPLVASIIPTNRCNLRCPYCGRWERPGQELTPDQWVAIIGELADLGCVRLSITGGEPLLFAGIEKLCSAAKGKRLRININTNGLLVEKKPEAIRMADSVTISLDGDKEAHDGVRGEGTYEGALRAAQAAREMGKDLSFYTVLSKRNLACLVHVADKAGELGGRAFYQPGTYLDFDGLKKNPEAPEVDEYRKAIDRLIEAKEKGAPVGNSFSGLKYIRQWPDKAPLGCYGGRLFVRIEADGQLRHCGRDGLTDENRVTEGVKQAIDRVPDPPCESCWSAARVEFNLMAGLNAGAIFDFLRIR